MIEPVATPRALAGASPELRRTGVLVVGGSVLTSVFFAHTSFTLFGQVQYSHTMVFATLIPLVVASIAISWIAALTMRLDASRRELERLALQDPLTGLANRRAAMARSERLVLAFAALLVGLSRVAAGGKALGGATALAGGSGVLATALLAVCMSGAAGEA
jgi:hypothetical protein